MKIRVIKTEVTNKGKYDLCKVTFRNLETDKVMSANLPSFKAKDVFETFKNAKADACFEVKVVKDGEYWTWESASEVEAPVPAQPKTEAPARKGTTTDRNWETAEERAMRQILIVRQSSVSTILSSPFGNQKDLDTVLVLAGKVEDWVMRGLGNKISEQAGLETPLDVQKAMKEILDMKDDVPA